MGYRSDVALCLSAKGKQALDVALLEAASSHEYYKEIRDFINSAEIGDQIHRAFCQHY